MGLTVEGANGPTDQTLFELGTYGYNCRDTSFRRGQTPCLVLDGYLNTINRDPRLVIVGLGIDSTEQVIRCPYVPFRIAAHLEAAGLNYRMLLLDIDEGVVADVLGRQRLYVSLANHSPEVQMGIQEEWERYLVETHQDGRVIHEEEEGLVFNPSIGKYTQFQSIYLEHGILAADVPQGFRQRLTTGDIKALQGNIAVFDLSRYGKADYVDCMNVLYLLSQQGQRAALANIATTLDTDGITLINDIAIRSEFGVPLFEERGGWLTDQYLGSLGLRKDKDLSLEFRNGVVLRKVGV